ncbi:MAG: HepT-like ribonuclease domain-containing protein [Chitinophagaceae bacterium]
MKDLRKYLLDIILTIEDIQSFANEYSLVDYEVVEKKWAVERGISIIGEALFKAHKLDPTLAVTNIQQIIGTRHIVIHDYDRVDPARLLVIVKKHLPILKTEIENILNELD